MVAKTRATGTRKIVRLVGVAGASFASLVLSVLLLGLRRFDRLVRRDVEALLARAASSREESLVTEEMLGDLPEPVQRYLRYTGIVGKPFVRTVRLEQKGALYLGSKQGWVPLEAEEHYTVQPPGFVWDANIHRGPLPIARGRDMYAGGEGSMLIKAGSLLTVVDDEGPEIDQGSMMRYLSEMIWFPTAFLGDSVSFEGINNESARVTLTDYSKSVSATMYFDREGRFTDFVAKRYRMVEGGYDLETWSTPAYEYGELAGLKLPVRGGAVWKLADGDLKYGDITITALEYDVWRQ
jgi:hypothetical protein